MDPPALAAFQQYEWLWWTLCQSHWYPRSTPTSWSSYWRELLSCQCPRSQCPKDETEVHKPSTCYEASLLEIKLKNRHRRLSNANPRLTPQWTTEHGWCEGILPLTQPPQKARHSSRRTLVDYAQAYKLRCEGYLYLQQTMWIVCMLLASRKYAQPP